MNNYQLIESWKNRGENAKEEVLCESKSKEYLAGILKAIIFNININGLGPEFPDERAHINRTKNEIVCYLGDELSKSEYVRSFTIKEFKGKWNFVSSEQFEDSGGLNFAGILSDGEHYLVWHAYKDEDDKCEMCHIYDSVSMFTDEICIYPWTTENDSLLLEALDKLPDGFNFTICDKNPLSKIKFKDIQ